jgi:hypothetical protein
MFFDRLQWISGIQKSWSIFSSLNCVINGFVWTKISSWKMFFSTISQPLAWHFWSQEFFLPNKKTEAAAGLFRCNDNNNKRFERIVYCTMTCKTLQNKKQAIFSNRVQLLNCSKFFFLPPNEVDRSLIWVVFLWYFGNYKY